MKPKFKVRCYNTRLSDNGLRGAATSTQTRLLFESRWPHPKDLRAATSVEDGGWPTIQAQATTKKATDKTFFTNSTVYCLVRASLSRPFSADTWPLHWKRKGQPQRLRNFLPAPFCRHSRRNDARLFLGPDLSLGPAAAAARTAEAAVIRQRTTAQRRPGNGCRPAAGRRR